MASKHNGSPQTGGSNNITTNNNNPFINLPSRYKSPKPSQTQLQSQARLSSPKTRFDNGLVTLRYEDSTPAKPPIAVTVAPPRQPPTDTHPALRRPMSAVRDLGKAEDERKRDSGLAPTTTSSNRGAGSVNTVDDTVLGVVINFNSISAAPATTAAESRSPVAESEMQGAGAGAQKIEKTGSRGSGSRWKPSSRKNSAPQTADSSREEFAPITTPIPTESWLDEEFLDNISFSKRGSIMMGGRKGVNGQARTNVGRRQPSVSLLLSSTVKVLSDDLEKESQKVRSMYEQGTGLDWENGDYARLNTTNIGGVLAQEAPLSSHGLLIPERNISTSDRPNSALSSRSETRREHELAGGIEDWEDVNGNDVDRYGFISMKRSPYRPGTPEPRPPQRVSTMLQLASEAPRKKRVFGRTSSTVTKTTARAPSRKVSARSMRTQGSKSSQRSNGRSNIRAAANRLPGNRDRRIMDEAGDMLTLPPGLADIAEDEEGGKAAADLKKKEWSRAEKWRTMAKVVKTGKDGEGMEFEFDTRSPKLVERTWKGIPDMWRSAAWYSFLSSSAKKIENSPNEEDIIKAFHKLLQASSPDDVQIDIDVPRTINSHIMFRRRYRGGQRLLFRVLHSLSLYFPDTGYVQGMASLAATLLCYYDEEKCFVMLVRMWTLRGLDKLYEADFPGLMAALDEFQQQWLKGNNAVSDKLNDLVIEPTAYGTRWYLTLFNYSIPFPAQLRVWDVFMLLGDPDPSVLATPERPFRGQLDVIHATSAALIDGTSEILLDSDFENAMKVLTSWIPIKDEELLMRVAGAEFRARRRRR